MPIQLIARLTERHVTNLESTADGNRHARAIPGERELLHPLPLNLDLMKQLGVSPVRRNVAHCGAKPPDRYQPQDECPAPGP